MKPCPLPVPLGIGFHRIDKATYLADPCAAPSLSSSIAELVVESSPAHAWSAHPRGAGHRKDPTRSMINGTIIDSLLLGGDTALVSIPEEMPDAKGVMVATGDALRLASVKTWAAEQAATGRQVVKRDDLAEAKTAAEEIRANLARAGIVFNGENQLTGVWQVGDVWCRMRLDHWLEDEALIVDLKTCDCAHPDALQRKMIDFGYDIQHAAYTSGVATLRPGLAGRVRMVFAFAETEPPYAVVVVPSSGSMRAHGDWRWNRAVKTWGACLAANRWPGYADGPVAIEAPPWALAKMVEGGSETVPF